MLIAYSLVLPRGHWFFIGFEESTYGAKQCGFSVVDGEGFLENQIDAIKVTKLTGTKYELHLWRVCLKESLEVVWFAKS